MDGPTSSSSDSALARLFASERLAGDARWFSLPGGEPLYSPGEPAEELYLVRAGKLGVFRAEEGRDRTFVGVIRPGEPAGEMALIAGTPHAASVVALRDTEILALSRADFFEAADRDPAVMNELARLMIQRARQAATQTPRGEPTVFGFMAVTGAVEARDLAEKIGAEIAALGASVDVIGVEAAHAPIEWFSQVEEAHDIVLYAAEAEEIAWKTVVSRQVDRMFLIGDGSVSPPQDIIAHPALTLQTHHLLDLILVQKPDCKYPKGSEQWQTAAGAARLFQMRDGSLGDVRRMARLLTGRSVGLVLSGGGARAYAHIGAIRALNEHGVPIDFVGGSSMGAIIGAGLAMGWDEEEMDRRIRAAFVTSSPLDDIAFPLIAMTRGEKVRARLKEHFDNVLISDLWLPFFCISSNLTSGSYQLHQQGSLRHALRASIALPGVMPPVTDGANVLVDGAVMKNFPADIMRSLQLGPVVGVDVSRGRSIAAKDVQNPGSVLHWLLSGEWRKGPPIVGLLMRAATVSTGRELAAAREATDLLILPGVDAVDMRDWKAYEPAVAAGYAAARQALDALDSINRSVTELRKSPRD